MLSVILFEIIEKRATLQCNRKSCVEFIRKNIKKKRYKYESGCSEWIYLYDYTSNSLIPEIHYTYGYYTLQRQSKNVLVQIFHAGLVLCSSYINIISSFIPRLNKLLFDPKGHGNIFEKIFFFIVSQTLQNNFKLDLRDIFFYRSCCYIVI